MKAKRIKNSIVKLGKNNNTNTKAAVKKKLKNKLRKDRIRADVLKPITPIKSEKAEHVSNGAAVGGGAVTVEVNVKRVPEDKTAEAAVSKKKKRNSSSSPAKKPNVKKRKREDIKVQSSVSNGERKKKKKLSSDVNASKSLAQSGPKSTTNLLKTSKKLDVGHDIPDDCGNKINLPSSPNNLDDIQETEMSKVEDERDAAQSSITESVSLDMTTEPQEESYACYDTQPRSDFKFSRSTRKGSSFTSLLGYCVVGKEKKKLLVSMRPVDKLVIEGCYFIKPVLGKVRILGYTINEGEKKAVFSPAHRAVIPVLCSHEGVSMVDRSHQGQEQWDPEGHSQRKDTPTTPGGLAVFLTEEMVQSLRTTYNLDDIALASLHLQTGDPVIVAELSKYHSRLPEVLHHIAVHSLNMNPEPRHFSGRPLWCVQQEPLPRPDSFTTNNLGPVSAVHYVLDANEHREGSEEIPLTTADNCDELVSMEENQLASGRSGSGTPPRCDDVSNKLQDFSCDTNDKILKPEEENNQHAEFQADEEMASAWTGVGRPTNTCDVYEWRSVLDGARPRIYFMGPPNVVGVPHSWYQALRVFKKEVVEVNINGFHLYPKRRVVIIGDKGAGKSTFLKYFINSLLDSFDVDATQKDSRGRDGARRRVPLPTQRKSVCCLDLDPGQPEQSLPGSMSVCLYRKPLLGPTFTYGLANVKSSQEVADKKKILERRRKMVQLLSLQKQTERPGKKSSGLLELTELLEDDENLDHTLPGEVTKQLLLGDVSPSMKPHMYVDMVRELMEAVRREHSDEPLVVNTMGWLSDMGMTFLLDILNIVRPTHVIHLTNDRKLELNFHYMNHLFKEKQLDSVSTVNPIFCYDYYQVMSPASTEQVLTPTPRTPGARDLRTLMFTSYFTSLWSTNQNTSLDVTTCKIGVKLNYTDLAVYDLRFSDDPQAVLENMRQNRALIALCSTDDSNIFSAGEESPKTVEFRAQCNLQLNNFFSDQFDDNGRQQNMRQTLIRQNAEVHSLFKNLLKKANKTSKSEDDRSNRTSMLTHRMNDLNQNRRRGAFEVHGWAIVLSVDTTTKEIHILTPTPDTALPKTNTLVRCNVDLPTKFKNLIFSDIE